MSLVFAVHSNSACAELREAEIILCFLEGIGNVLFPYIKKYECVWNGLNGLNGLFVTISTVSVFAFPTDALDWCWLCPIFGALNPRKKRLKPKWSLGAAGLATRTNGPRGSSGDTPKFTACAMSSGVSLCSQDLEENWKGSGGRVGRWDFPCAASRAAPEVLELHLLGACRGVGCTQNSDWW